MQVHKMEKRLDIGIKLYEKHHCYPNNHKCKFTPLPILSRQPPRLIHTMNRNGKFYNGLNKKANNFLKISYKSHSTHQKKPIYKSAIPDKATTKS